MEAVSLGVSVVALASLFETALDCFKHVKVAKSFGSDYQTYVLRLQNLRLRFSRWGEAVGIGSEVAGTNQLKTTALSEPDVEQAEALVNHIISLFSEAEELAERYSGKQGDLVSIDNDAEGMGDIGKLCQKMRDICLRRQRNTSTMKKAKWSIYSKEKFFELISSMQSLIDDLVGLFSTETGTKKEQNLCYWEAKELREEKALSKLQSVALSQDVQLAKAIATLAEIGTSKSTAFNNNDNTKVMNQSETQNIYGGQHIGSF